MKQTSSIKISLVLILALSSIYATPARAQELEFNSDGLYNAAIFDYIFRGHFEKVEVDREDIFFLGIINQYMRAYGNQCSGNLPHDKVKIMEDVCTVKEVVKNGYGVQLSERCVEWESQWTGLYANPDLYNASRTLTDLHSRNALETAVQSLTDPNYLGNSIDLFHKAKGLKMDMTRIFQINPCSGGALKRFEQNLILFAQGKTSIRMDGKSKYDLVKKSGGPSGVQDFDRLIDDLVNHQSKTWMMNRYLPGTISSTSSTLDDQGRTQSLAANYLYSGIAGKRKGFVRISFKNGIPTCIYFWDNPNNCKIPSSSIVASFAQGSYSM